MLLAVTNVKKIRKPQIVFFLNVENRLLKREKGSRIDARIHCVHLRRHYWIRRREITPHCITHGEDRSRTRDGVAQEEAVRDAFQDRSFVRIVMENEIVHRAHEWNGTEERHIELRSEEERASAPANETREANLLTE